MPKTGIDGALIGLTMSVIAGTVMLIAQNTELSAMQILLGCGAAIMVTMGGAILSVMIAWLNRLASAWIIMGSGGALIGGVTLAMLHGGSGLIVGLALGALFSIMISLLFEPESIQN